MPRTYDRAVRKEVIEMLSSGFPVPDIEEKTGVSRTTIYEWKKKERERKKKESQSLDGTISNFKNQLSDLSKVKNPSEAVVRKITMLTNTIAKLKRVRKKEKKQLVRNIPRIKFNAEMIENLRKEVLEKIPLHEYQENFFLSEATFRIVLKARQIGFSFVAAIDALIGALASGRDQLFLSASEEQAIILTRYVREHAAKLNIQLGGGDKEIRLPNGAYIKALANNFRTVQGFKGDLWMDEFAWYPNPKQMWGVFLPAIGAVKGRVTVMSTPFEADGHFYNLFHDKEQFFMFDRFRIDIYQAMADGLDFDLVTMKALFDDSTWASMYECQFADDEAAFFPISLIKSCVNDKLPLSTAPVPNNSRLHCGYDVGRIKHLSVLSALQEKETEKRSKYVLTHLDVLQNADFDEQEFTIQNHMNLFPRAKIKIDKTGLGMQLAESICKKFNTRAQGVYFTNSNKEFMVLNAKKLFEDRRIEIPNIPELIADIHSIKRKAGKKSFIYDSIQNVYGHAGRAWSLFLAASDIKGFGSSDAYGTEGDAWLI